MDNMNTQRAPLRFSIRHRGRLSQVRIYFGKLLRMFVYQNDWKVLPMAALIAGLVGMVVRKRMFINMEGTLMGAFALVCVGIWNGCFNSIQVICRERDVIKREHRSGMHISSYVFSHMMYQALLCLAQTGVTLYVTLLVGVKYPTGGLVTRWFLLDFAISMFLISYASDMLSLWVSSLAHTTTAAMTIMPFILIFQLVFSGGMLTLPAWTKTLTYFTISNPGLKVIAAQADTNNRPYATISNMLGKMRNTEVEGTFTLGQALELLQDEDNPAISELRAQEISDAVTLGDVGSILNSSPAFADFRQERVTEDTTAGEMMTTLSQAEELAQKYAGTPLGTTMTVGEAIDYLAGRSDIQEKRDTKFTVKTTVGRLMDMAGEDKVKTFIGEKAAQASYNPAYDSTADNVAQYWLRLAGFVLFFALLATVTLEFIDKDKR